MSKENQYVPKYIKDAPWYQPNTNPDDYLSHHRSDKSAELNSEPKKGQGIHDDFIPSEVHVSKTTKRKQKGRCKNCGGDHDRKDCLERPGTGLKNGVEVVNKRNEDVDYDGKRDRWYGYDVNDYTKYLKQWKEKEEKKAPEEARVYDTDEEIELRELGLLDDPEFKDAVKQEGEKTVRLREDKAVYLTNVRNENISYDPKSRMIRDDQTGYFNEDNLFVKRLTGEAKEFENSKKFAWDDKRRGLIDDNLVANPTLGDRKIMKLSEEEKQKKEKMKNALLDRYGGSLAISSEEPEEEPPVEEDQPATQHDPTKSKYKEDVFPKNHTSVWGSFYSNGQWGYACCQSLYKNSYCSK